MNQTTDKPGGVLFIIQHELLLILIELIVQLYKNNYHESLSFSSERIRKI